MKCNLLIHYACSGVDKYQSFVLKIVLKFSVSVVLPRCSNNWGETKTLGKACHNKLWEMICCQGSKRKLEPIPSFQKYAPTMENTTLLLGDNYKWWWQNPNIGDPHGCLGGKYKPFGKQISFLAWRRKKPEPFRARFENTMGNPFFDFVKYRPKRSKINLE